MLRVHPDRVAKHPAAAQANEASFKVLLNYLEELKGDGGSPSGQYHLDFYVESSASQQLPKWQDLTSNDSNLASAKFAQDARYFQPGQEEHHGAKQQVFIAELHACRGCHVCNACAQGTPS